MLLYSKFKNSEVLAMSHAAEIVMLHNEYFHTSETQSYEFRMDALFDLKKAIIKNESAIMDALHADLGKSPFEAFETEIGITVDEITYMMKHLKSFMKPRRVLTPLSQFPSKSFIMCEPYGTALIMSPWNYPFQLTIEPLVGAIGAGNTAILKPSDYSRHTSQIIADIVKEIYPQEYVSVVLGGREANQDLLQQKFDVIFFTGGVTVGKLVMESAAKFVTPVTLELGGKSPCIVDSSANIKLAAKRIAWGKFLNAGQTCVAPDHVYVDASVKQEFIAELRKSITEFYTTKPLECADFPKIISRKHYDRLIGLLTNEEIVIGGKSDPDTLRIEPTVLDNVTYSHNIMQSEIFGPILPIIEYKNIHSVIAEIRNHPKPLALYLFSANSATVKTILNTVPYGGGCINDVVVQLATSRMPFGGVGNSGIGSYHGKASFDTFTHRKSILRKSNMLDLPIRYLPGTPKKFKQLRKFIGKG
ncbi:MAG: aldehyde dehydrogenase [Christensenella sp.]